LPPHLSYVSTLPDITQKPKRNELKQRLDHWHLEPYSSQAIIDKAIDQWQTRQRACV